MDDRIRKYYQNELSAEERISLLNDAEADKELKETFILYQQMHALVSLSTRSGDKDKAMISYTKFLASKKQKSFLRLIGYAAGILLLICGGWVASSLYEGQQTTMNRLYVPPGQRACLTLTDGTVVWVNANSTLTYPSRFTKKERRVSLIGEGFFDVAKENPRPFVVSTQAIDIRVLGTKFNVCSYPGSEYITTSLLEGTVKVYEPHKEKDGILLYPNQKLYYTNEKIYVESMEKFDDLLWRKGVYSFDKEMFGEIIKKLERYYDVAIHVKDSSILDFDYTAKFRQRDGIDEILRQIQKTQPFTIEKDDEQKIIILSK